MEVNIPDGITLISEETVTLTLEKKVQEQPEQEHGTQEESGTQNETSDEGREEEPAEG